MGLVRKKRANELVSVAQAARELGVTVQAVRSAIKRGSLPVEEMTLAIERRVIGIPRAALAQYAEKNRPATSAA